MQIIDITFRKVSNGAECIENENIVNERTFFVMLWMLFLKEFNHSFIVINGDI